VGTLTVWKFDSEGGAEMAESRLQLLAKERLLNLEDAAVVSWPADKKAPKTRQMHGMAGLGALGGAFWGMLFGLLFFVPLLGMAIGAAAGAIGGSLTDVGIDDDFIDAVRREVQPGTSALFLMTSDVVLDKVQGEFSDLQPQLIHSNLSAEQESRLREVFQPA
jgi:uncharacterized membrane protein